MVTLRQRQWTPQMHFDRLRCPTLANEVREIRLGFVITYLESGSVESQSHVFRRLASPEPRPGAVLLEVPYLHRVLPPRPPPHSLITTPSRRR
ncbi:hypothetical protein TIFTF001_048599 [Ficus carica]|uniref:Uncharacterized protein n=1 Tax=Ficus carica TaxID=3494 RepID=A0AA88CJ17_FICCA|nr:hypothetical protein TIFTF001_048599 [Ficus carica]